MKTRRWQLHVQLRRRGSFISNCNGGDRLDYLAKLVAALPQGREGVHNYGGCNRDSEPDRDIQASPHVREEQGTPDRETQ